MGRPPRISKDDVLRQARQAFARKGYAATTLADIATDLGVTPAALLRHCPTKQALFDQAMQAGENQVPDFVLALREANPHDNPRIVLRGIMERIIPFFIKKVEENIAVYMHEKSVSLTLPFDPKQASPPARALALFENYFRRCIAAGTIDGVDPRAAAVLMVGSLQSYVFINYVFKATATPYPIPAYIDAMLEVWTRGVIREKGARKIPKRRGGGNRGKST